MPNFIPLSIPNFEGNEKKYVNEALDAGWVSTGGAYITKLEQSMAKFLQVENVAACQSGTSALHLSLVEAGIKPGDVVLVPPVTFIAAVNPVKKSPGLITVTCMPNWRTSRRNASQYPSIANLLAEYIPW